MLKRQMLAARFLPTVAFALAAAACSQQEATLTFVTPGSPLDRTIAADIGRLLNTGDRVNVEFTDTPMTAEDALDAVRSGAADLALVTNSLPFRDDIATVLPLYQSVLHIARRKDWSVEGGSEMFRDVTVFAGPEGSASRLFYEKIVDRYDLGNNEYRYAASPMDSPDLFVVFAPISPDLGKGFRNYRLYSMAPLESIGRGGVVDTAVLYNPYFRPFVIPVNTYGEATPTAIATVAVDTMLVTSTRADDTVVYDLVSEILRTRPALSALYPGLFRSLTEDFDVSRSTFVVHRGTQSFLQRSAPTIYERYSGVAEVVVTLIVALGSATVAGVRIYRMRRKNRIDRFYAEALALWRSVPEDGPTEDRSRARGKIRELQSAAFDLLIDEKLSADESFHIFVDLSNDLIRRLDA